MAVLSESLEAARAVYLVRPFPVDFSTTVIAIRSRLGVDSGKWLP